MPEINFKRLEELPEDKNQAGRGVVGRAGSDANRGLLPVVRAARARARAAQRTRTRSPHEGLSEADDVIDLGAPRRLRRAPPERPPGVPPPRVRRASTPNPRLYPGPQPRAVEKSQYESRLKEGRRKRRKRSFRQPVPNSRLYRPAPEHAPPPPPRPRASWSPPAPACLLDTASRAALHLASRRSPLELRRSLSPPIAAPASRRLVVTLPSAPLYRPLSNRLRRRILDGDSSSSTPLAARHVMDAGNRHSTSPEDCSDGNDTLSAPSEFLAEFLSAIMRRQYAEALKYCRLILQYEPHNATARGFYPLLQHKVHAATGHERTPHEGMAACAECEAARGSSSEASAPQSHDSPSHRHEEVMQQEADSSQSEGSADASVEGEADGSEGWCASQSSLELDSSEAVAHSSPSLSLSRRTEPTDRTDSGSGASGACWESSGSASRSTPDDNGNAPAPRSHTPAPEDVENDNAATDSEPALTAHVNITRSAASLRRLRAQFACSIK